MEIENTHISKVMGGYRETTGKDIIATGIAELDKQIEGFGMGELVTLLGYPGDDKMNAAIRIMSYQAVDNGNSSAYFCTRETPEIIARRLLCYRCSTLPNRMLEYEINGEPYEWKHWVDENKEKIAASPVYLYPNERLYIDELCEQCCSYAKSGVKVIYIYFDNEAIKNDAVCKLKALVSRFQQPCLQDLSWCQLDEYSDMVIGFLNCDSFGYVSEEGIDIKGKMRIKVVKDRHNKQHAHFYLNYLGFIMKQFAEPPTISDSSRQIIEDFYTPFE